jgi:hypothetical protein
MNPVLLLGLGGLATWTLRQRFNNRVERDIRALGAVRPVVPSDLSGLPSRVRTLLTRALDDPTQAPTLVTVTQEGQIRFRPGDAWSPFEAEESIAIGHVGFTWRADLSHLGWLRSEAVESLCRDVGRLESRILGALPLGAVGGANVVRGQKVSYLAELPWAPHAMFANPNVRWEVEGDDTLRITIPSTDEPVALTVDLNDKGDIAAMRGRRTRSEATGWRDTPWSKEFGDYGPIGGFRVPRRTEARWETDPPFVYLRARIRALRTT